MTGWVDCMEQQPNRGDKVVVVFANGGLKAFEVKTVPLSEHAIAWIKLPRIPRNVIANQAKRTFERAMYAYEHYAVLNADAYGEESLFDHISFAENYIKKMEGKIRR